MHVCVCLCQFKASFHHYISSQSTMTSGRLRKTKRKKKIKKKIKLIIRATLRDRVVHMQPCKDGYIQMWQELEKEREEDS